MLYITAKNWDVLLFVEVLTSPLFPHDIISHAVPAIYDALHHCKKLRRVALCRSNSKRVFTDYGKQVTYACVGPQPSRFSNTVLDNPPFVDALPQPQWEKLVWLMKRAETSFRSFADHCVISHLHHAKKLVPFKTFSSHVDKTSALSSDFFCGIALGTNVFLRCHTDADFTMSISQVFLKGRPKYQLNDHVIVYFCFPTLGVAVPLRPGDYFMFNALITHCMSSRCNMEDDIMCTSVYLKTAIVGMHNNDLKLTHQQSQVADRLYLNKHKWLCIHSFLLTYAFILMIYCIQIDHNCDVLPLSLDDLLN